MKRTYYRKNQLDFAYNIITDSLKFEETFCTTPPDVRELLADRIEKISKVIASIMKDNADVEIIFGAIPIINGEKMSALCAKAVQVLLLLP